MNIKVLHINRNYITSPLHQIMKNHLDQYEILNEVFAPTDNKENSLIVPNKNVTVCECFTKWDRFIFDLKQSKIIKALDATYDVSTFNCIHAYTLFTDGNAAMYLSQKYGIPYIVTVRNTDVNKFFKKRPYLRRRGIKIMENANVICFLSESYQETVLNLYIPESKRNAIRAKSRIIPNGIDDFWLQNTCEQRHELHKPIRLIYAGRIDKNKNIPTVQKAMDILREHEYETTLSVVGKIQDEKEFRIIEKDPFTKYHQAMPKENLIDVYRSSDIFIMPSHTETFGLVYAEAMSQGLPVIYTKGQGFDGQFLDGEVGYAVDDKDEWSIVEAVKKIVNRYENISKHAIEGAKKFKWEDICETYRQIYYCIVSENV